METKSDGMKMDKEKRYRIREIAQLTGVPENAIRFYEKYEIILPSRGNGNYRYYSETDLLRIMAVRTYRSLGFSLRESKELLDGMNHRERADALRRRIGLLDAEIRRLERMKRNLLARITDLEDAIALRSGYAVVTLPGTYWCFSHDDAHKRVDLSRLNAGLQSRIMEKLPFFHLEGHLRNPGTAEAHECEWGIALDEDFGCELTAGERESLVYMPPMRCVTHTYMDVGARRVPDLEDFGDIIAYAGTNGLRCAGPIRLRLIPGKRREDGYVYQLLRCFLPVEEEPVD